MKKGIFHLIPSNEGSRMTNCSTRQYLYVYLIFKAENLLLSSYTNLSSTAGLLLHEKQTRNKHWWTHQQPYTYISPSSIGALDVRTLKQREWHTAVVETINLINMNVCYGLRTRIRDQCSAVEFTSRKTHHILPCDGVNAVP